MIPYDHLPEALINPGPRVEGYVAYLGTIRGHRRPDSLPFKENHERRSDPLKGVASQVPWGTRVWPRDTLFWTQGARTGLAAYEGSGRRVGGVHGHTGGLGGCLPSPTRTHLRLGSGVGTPLGLMGGAYLRVAPMMS